MKLPAAKRAWRQIAVELFALIPREERRRLDEILSERLCEIVLSRNAGFVMGYAALADEADLSAFFRGWLDAGGRLGMPVWRGGSEMLVREVRDWDAEMRPGRGGILEPDGACREVGFAELDLVVAPGRFFSESRQRLGRGAGCYDVLLGKGRVFSIGTGYDFQVVPALPVGAADALMDIVLTPTRLITFA